MEYFFEKNNYLLDHEINKTFDEILVMSKEEFRQWAIDLRKAVVYSWDVLGIPPRTGFDKKEIIDQFLELSDYQTDKLLTKDLCTGNKDLLRNTTSLGNAVNQFFPTMMKTRINYTDDGESGRSIYDFFADDALLETFHTYATRHFKRDSFYNHSRHVEASDSTSDNLPCAATGFTWVTMFELQNYRNRGKFDYFLCPVKEDFEYTGYAEHLKHADRLTLNRQEIEALSHDILPAHCQTNVDWDRSELYRIRTYTHGQRLFPIGFKNFRVSFCQYAVNFPPLTAKWVYETFTQQWKDEDTIYVWDPSAGWGGRLLGSLCVDRERHLMYLGNDPNTDHNTTPGRTKYHEIDDFYRTHCHKKYTLIPTPYTDFKFWQLGSEVMQFDPAFQEYNGKLSLVFTSPPYFSKERYSEDPTQSAIKFTEYEEWAQNFLFETLNTAVEWLRPGGYIVWNIADAKFGAQMLPLEADSQDILQKLGMTFVAKYKMTLGSMPGGNRVDKETGLPKAKNFCKTKKGIWLKYEPLFVYQKQ